MALARRPANRPHGYTVDEVARFLQYDSAAVRYWLRTGHLAGTIDEYIGDWRVSAADLISFLRQSSEPMPTGVPHHPVVTQLPLTVPAGMRKAPVWLVPQPDGPDDEAESTDAIAGSRGRQQVGD
jgi:hypothetical protein